MFPFLSCKPTRIYPLRQDMTENQPNTTKTTSRQDALRVERAYRREILDPQSSIDEMRTPKIKTSSGLAANLSHLSSPPRPPCPKYRPPAFESNPNLPSLPELGLGGLQIHKHLLSSVGCEHTWIFGMDEDGALCCKGLCFYGLPRTGSPT